MKSTVKKKTAYIAFDVETAPLTGPIPPGIYNATVQTVLTGNIVNIEDVKKGDYFKVLRKPDIITMEDGSMQICPASLKKVQGYSVQVKGDYNRFAKQYAYHKFDDINHWGHKKKGTKVFVDFDF